MRNPTSKAFAALTLCFSILISTQVACSKSQLVSSAEDVLSVLNDPVLLNALRTISPAVLTKIQALVPTANALVSAIKNGDTSTALAAVNTIFPVIEEAAALFTSNPAVLAVLALANIGLHFIIDHVKNTTPAVLAKKSGSVAVSTAVNYGSQPVWGCKYRKDKRCQ